VIEEKAAANNLTRLGDGSINPAARATHNPPPFALIWRVSIEIPRLEGDWEIPTIGSNLIDTARTKVSAPQTGDFWKEAPGFFVVARVLGHDGTPESKEALENRRRILWPAINARARQ
jgi:hypothetical protein